MMTKTKIAFVAALILGSASAALASGDGPSHEGFDIGPLGQCFVPPDCGDKHDASAAHSGNAGKTHVFVLPEKHRHRSPP